MPVMSRAEFQASVNEQVEIALSACSPTQRTYIEKYYLYGRERAEIAAENGIATSTVDSQITFALKKARERLEGKITRYERALLNVYLNQNWSIEKITKRFHYPNESDCKRALGGALLKLARLPEPVEKEGEKCHR